VQNKDTLKLDIATKKDIVREYCSRTVMFDEEFVAEFLDIMIEYIKTKMQDSRTTSINIPYLGKLSRQFNPDKLLFAHWKEDKELHERLLTDLIFNKKIAIVGGIYQSLEQPKEYELRPFVNK